MYIKGRRQVLFFWQIYVVEGLLAIPAQNENTGIYFHLKTTKVFFYWVTMTIISMF